MDFIELGKMIEDVDNKEFNIFGNVEYSLEQKYLMITVLENKPCRVYDYEVPVFKMRESSAKGFKTKLEKQLVKILKFIKYIKDYRYDKGCTLLPLSTRNVKIIEIWGDHENAVNGFKLMKEIGLIEVWWNKYKYKGAGSYCYRYLYFKEIEDKLLEYCKLNNININNNNINKKEGINILIREKCKNDENEEGEIWNLIDEESGDYDFDKYIKLLNIINKKDLYILIREKCKNLIDFDVKDVRFSSCCEYKLVDGVSKEEFEYFLNECLYENYKGFKEFQNLVNEINRIYYKDNDDFKLKFIARFEWKRSKKKYDYVSSIGIRLTNRLCNVRKEKRKEILKDINYDLEKDVKSSIGRVNIGLNTGKWLDEDIDIYKLIFDGLKLDCEWNDEIREYIKSMFVRAYFDISNGTFARNIVRELLKDKGLGKEEYKIEFNRILDDIKPVCYKYRNTVLKVLGKKVYNNEIYFYESSIYLLVLYDLLKSGYKVWMVYDCFYCNKDESFNLWNDTESFEKLVRNQLIFRFGDYYSKYIK